MTRTSTPTSRTGCGRWRNWFNAPPRAATARERVIQPPLPGGRGSLFPHDPLPFPAGDGQVSPQHLHAHAVGREPGRPVGPAEPDHAGVVAAELPAAAE